MGPRPVVVTLAVLLLAGCGSRADDVLLDAPRAATGTVSASGSASAPSSAAASLAPAPVTPPVPSPPSGIPRGVPDDARGATASPAAAGPRRALDLVGRWTVTGPSVREGSSLYVADEIAVFQACGVLTLIGCDGAPVAGWVAQAARAGLQGAALVLHAPDGEVLGRLVRG